MNTESGHRVNTYELRLHVLLGDLFLESLKFEAC